MARITLEYEEVELENDRGHEVPGIRATCPECGESEESYGTGRNSRIRCLMKLKEQCDATDPATGRGHYYVDPDDGGGSGRLPDPVVKPWWER